MIRENLLLPFILVPLVCMMYPDACEVSQLIPDILIEKEGKKQKKHLEMVSGHNAPWCSY